MTKKTVEQLIKELDEVAQRGADTVHIDAADWCRISNKIRMAEERARR